MYSLITIFYVAEMGIVTMLLLKRHELMTGRPTIVSRLGTGSDHAFHSAYSFFRLVISYFNRKTFIVVVEWLAFHLLFHTRKIYVEAKDKALANPHSKKVIDAVRGRANIKDHGASFYLRRISDK